MLKPYVLVVDDEPDIRQLVKEILEDEGYNVTVARDGAAARDAVAARAPSLILLDIWMPDVDGITLLKEFVNVHKLQCPVVMMSGHGTVEAAVEATRLGAHDFIEKPLSLSKLLLTVESALASGQSRPRTMVVQHEKLEPVEIVGKSEMARALQQKLEQCAQHDVTVLMLGEAGAGKAHCARYIHTHSGRSEGPFIEMHTAALVPSHQDSINELLLGRVEDHQIHPGFLEQAAGGTLYIDDVAELDSNTQAALYGVLTSPAFYRVNDDEAVTADLRVIAASRYDLEQEVRAGRFREDLYHCLKVFPVSIAPLREHSEDISELLHYYVRLFSDREGLPYRDFSMAAQNRLRNHDWPGNILELENLVRRLLMSDGQQPVELDEIGQALEQSTADTQSQLRQAQPPEFALPLRQAREQFERAYLEFHLRKSHGSVGKVAKLAGMERTHLYRKLRSLGIDTKHTQTMKE
jgi:two-component system nitrogen regulation response regulator NtrX